MIAALYVDPRGPYPKMVGVDCWDEARNAKLYRGPNPVVAHPPCGPWGRLSFLCTKQDATCAPYAVAQVRMFGGVLEHPTGSQLWKHCQLPKPGDPPDSWGGFTVSVRQVAWGHCCAKPTLLYVVGVPRERVERGIITGGIETHRVTNGSRGKTYLPRARAADIGRTPPLFATWLVSLAESAVVK